MVFIPTPTRDSNWIAVQALTRLGRASVDNPAAPEDIALAVDRLDAVSQDLQGRGILYVADLDNVPASVAQNLADRIAIALKPDFGDTTPDGQGTLPPVLEVEARLRRLSADTPSYGPQQVQFS